jgi:Xaa-Pro aminopeptidase
MGNHMHQLAAGCKQILLPPGFSGIRLRAMTDSKRLAAFRAQLRKMGLTAFIVPRQDEFQGEYVAAYAERLRWLTGFAGSWGVAVITLKTAAIFVDGRYTIQVRKQVDGKLIKPHHLTEDPPAAWIERSLKKGDALGYDPWLVTAGQAGIFEQACKKAGARLVAVTQNPVDAIWEDQPARPTKPLSVQPTQFAGVNVAEKQKQVASLLAEAGADATVLTEPDQVAWAFNIRGHDVPYTPVVLAYAIMKRKGKAELFIDKTRLPEDVASHIKSSVVVRKPEELEAALKALGKAKAVVRIDQSWTPARIKSLLSKAGARVSDGRNVTVMPKARKNRAEQEGARAAHRRDGIAMARFLHWFEGEAPKGGLTEWSAAEKLREFREATGMLLDLSFSSIPGFGPNAAIPHYSVKKDSALTIGQGIFLIDSGGQYQDGTTDITRTVIVGEPTAEMEDRFTRVLKGMIGLSRLRFPNGTVGSQMDVLARQHLWAAGLDYDHGTGHGVGSYLSVHEGPARINKSDRVPFEPGMILSNEPGYYKAEHFGIRIENLLLVQEPASVKGGEREMMGFETLTLCPIDRRLIDVGLLTREERDWLDAYHARVEREIGPGLAGDELAWLKRACAPLS